MRRIQSFSEQHNRREDIEVQNTKHLHQRNLREYKCAKFKSRRSFFVWWLRESVVFFFFRIYNVNALHSCRLARENASMRGIASGKRVAWSRGGRRRLGRAGLEASHTREDSVVKACAQPE